ncbi:MAG: hypothetical protein Ta2B_01770 [Termitinemataceae bacterium]|nr:MAG: hypothetical protein Ta2B_01770 [Termitinemataceae bacterium]
MQYKQKLTALCSICAALLIIYILTFVFNKEKSDVRSAQWTILSEKVTSTAEKIEISGKSNIKLVKDGSKWAVSLDDSIFPAKQDKIKAFFADLAAKGEYSVRSAKGGSLDEFGLGANAESIKIYGANDALLLDLLVGKSGITGKNVFLSKRGEKEVRSGADTLTQYLNGSLSTWEDLRLFAHADKDGEPAITSSAVQRVMVYQRQSDQSTDAVLTADWAIVRSDKGWKFESASTGSEDGGAASGNVDTTKADTFIQGILDSNADDFVTSLQSSDAVFAVKGKVPGRIILETEDGKDYTVTLGPKVNEKYTAVVGGTAANASSYVYALADWTVNRLWRSGDTVKE